jgi:glycosyltransferase involved in cell wall biosynthesis
VVLALSDAFPSATIHTTLYDPAGTYPEFAGRRVKVSPLDKVPGLRRRHRLALPALAAAVSTLRIDAEVTICSSSGWAHGFPTTGAKVVYCHTPARWLYQADAYLPGMPVAARLALAAMGPGLRRWDRKAAHGADRYIVNSTAVADAVWQTYGIDATVVPPPVSVDTAGDDQALAGCEPGFFLCVSRLLPYKHVDEVVSAFRLLPEERLVVVGDGPMAAALASGAPGNVRFVGSVGDAELRWLYRSCTGLVSASYEDFGLTPLEAAAYGKPSAVLRFGGFLDTILEGETGVYFQHPQPGDIASALRSLRDQRWSSARLVDHAAAYRPERFASHMREAVQDLLPASA